MLPLCYWTYLLIDFSVSTFPLSYGLLATQCSVFLWKLQLERVIPLLSVVSSSFRVQDRALSVATRSIVIYAYAAALTSFYSFLPCPCCFSNSGCLRSSSRTPAVLLFQGFCMTCLFCLECWSSRCLQHLLPLFSQVFAQMALLKAPLDHKNLNATSLHSPVIPSSFYAIVFFLLYSTFHYLNCFTYLFVSISRRAGILSQVYPLHLDVLTSWWGERNICQLNG